MSPLQGPDGIHSETVQSMGHSCVLQGRSSVALPHSSSSVRLGGSAPLYSTERVYIWVPPPHCALHGMLLAHGPKMHLSLQADLPEQGSTLTEGFEQAAPP